MDIGLHDDSLMWFGVHKDERLGDIDDGYWRWFLKQEWSSKYPGLVRYAQAVDD